MTPGVRLSDRLSALSQHASTNPCHSSSVAVAAAAMSNTPLYVAAMNIDEQIFGELIHTYGPQLSRYVQSLTADPHLTEDIVQETLFRVWQRPQTLTTHHGSVRPWLFTVARNLAHDHRRRSTGQTDLLEDIPVAENGINQVLIAYDVQEALRRLSTGHRAVLVEVYYNYRPLAEVADVLGLPLGTVKSRLYYALRSLREDIGRA
jgi:RNA polymerase sigma-70 factor (ECF subfamily)